MSNTYKELFESFEQKLSILNDDFDCLKKVAKSMIEKVEDEKNNNENMIKQYKKYEAVESEIIKLNVGGTLFSSLKSTLTKQIKNKDGELYQPNMFEGLLNGFVKPKYDENKAIFIDRNPKHFSYILDYLRMANTECDFEIPDIVEKSELSKEAKFYNIQGLVKMAESLSNGMISTILNQHQVEELIKLCEFNVFSKWNLLYRGSRDGFQASSFHSKCDFKPHTLTVIKSTGGYIFGGYTTKSWDGPSIDKSDPEAFLFSLVNAKKRPLKIMPGNFDGTYGIYCNPAYGPSFGGGDDLQICDCSNTINSSYSNLGFTYKSNNIESHELKTFFAGSYNFTVSEIEVFQIIDS